MARDPRYDVLFTPVKIGPKTAKNRFYQVPHCDGFGFHMPHGDAAFRSIKAEGGWAVVCTEQCSIHPTSDATPFPETRLWDDSDAKQLAVFVEAVHEHGALAGIQLAHNSSGISNRTTREVPLGPSANTMYFNIDPIMGREMDKADIREFRRWHVEAVKRALSVDFDIIYIYCGHHFTMPAMFLSPLTNHRSDEYGGSVENRARLIGELLEDTKEAVGDKAAVAIRFTPDEGYGPAGITPEVEGRAVLEMFAELPDLWDICLGGWEHDSGPSRFDAEGYQEPINSLAKKITNKPVVGTGRFTSPDTMVSQIERGILDFIGAARPSIADPFLPKKIEEGRNEDIRECIGCNICVASENIHAPIRCTQNPAAGEEWRRGWHPEEIAVKGSEDSVLIVGAGPAGLECARALGQRGYKVHLVEADEEIGGRVAFESALPGLAEWGRVRDYRQTQIAKMKNVEIHTGSRLTADDVLGYGAEVVVLATGSLWRKDGAGFTNKSPIPGSDGANVYTPDDLRDGVKIEGPVVVFDDDHYYMGGVIAEKLRAEGNEVTLVTPQMAVSLWADNTMERPRIIPRLLDMGIELVTDRNLANIGGNGVELACVYSGKTEHLACRSVVVVASRLPDDGLYRELTKNPAKLEKAEIRTLAAIGDSIAAGTIQTAVASGHRFARELDGPEIDDVPFRRERIALEHSAPQSAA